VPGGSVPYLNMGRSYPKPYHWTAARPAPHAAARPAVSRDMELSGFEPLTSWVRWKSGHLPAPGQNYREGTWLWGFDALAGASMSRCPALISKCLDADWTRPALRATPIPATAHHDYLRARCRAWRQAAPDRRHGPRRTPKLSVIARAVSLSEARTVWRYSAVLRGSLARSSSGSTARACQTSSHQGRSG
jgi:hypothetical protein